MCPTEKQQHRGGRGATLHGQLALRRRPARPLGLEVGFVGELPGTALSWTPPAPARRSRCGARLGPSGRALGMACHIVIGEPAGALTFVNPPDAGKERTGVTGVDRVRREEGLGGPLEARGAAWQRGRGAGAGLPRSLGPHEEGDGVMGALSWGASAEGTRGPVGGTCRARGHGRVPRCLRALVPALCSVPLRVLTAQPTAHGCASTRRPLCRAQTMPSSRPWLPGGLALSRGSARCVVTCVRGGRQGNVCSAGKQGLGPGDAGARGAVSAGHPGGFLEARPLVGFVPFPRLPAPHGWRSGGRGDRWASARWCPRSRGVPAPCCRGLACPAQGAHRFLGQGYF